MVNLFYGAGFSVAKLVMPRFIMPFGFILIRVSVSGILFFIIQRWITKESIHLRDIPLLLWSAIFGVVINQEMFFLGLERTTPINAALIMIMTPILVFLISFTFRYETATWQKALGLFFGAGGALLIMGGKNFSFSSKTILGDLFILINAASYAVYLVIVRPLMKKYHPLTVVTYVFLLGWLPVFIMGYPQFWAIDWQSFTVTAWIGLFFIVVFTTFLAYLLNMLALKEVSSSVVGAYIYLQPVLATLISVFLRQDSLTSEKIIAAVSIFLGVFLVSFSPNKVFKQNSE
jgi:drug/metabolite transporter (DMT)-like permease